MRALVIAVNLNKDNFQCDIDEFIMLAQSAGANILHIELFKKDMPDNKFFIGSGNVQKILSLLNDLSIEIILFNQALLPSQHRNLEKIWNVRVVDRVSLILDIFALRAKSHEGKLQVELAQLKHLSTRLTRLWTHLERQRGGIGMRGPGESQLEMDRRVIGSKVKILKERIKKIKLRRISQRGLRERNGAFSVSLVGYTNSGKSTIFNILAKDKVYVANQLFATLDITSRRIWVGDDIDKDIILSDTVGFIRDLPHSIVEAFHATLEETASADLLLHIVDSSSNEMYDQIENVNKVIKEIGASNIPTVLVYNKTDKSKITSKLLYDDSAGLVAKVFMSAVNLDGVDFLKSVISNASKVLRNNV
ncbi:GTP-binding protein HflX [Candidatus Kinetoplastibacterium blastocrithidii TCC012E]|uniref:GTPase HflX n=1 Tax=Candidatus Kinetoplastidibacterium blastocrithidiae TCC012E TaxID=1208922 RepID=M1M0L7_9PROT|nr:GTPase HflX [Candidatus Kinetoplastibacterium blastocrithidii]AGF49816.1 GTP-binding protein HflX [Candidatus Kinetoplastibacterium blastocrithidii TCC012E]